MSLFALLTFTQMEILSFAKEQADSYTGRKKKKNGNTCTSFFNSGRDTVYGCKIDPCCIETCKQVYRQRCSCLFSSFTHRDVANNWFLLCHQWCFSIKVHIEKCDERAIMETAIKWYFSNAIFLFFFFQLRDISRHRITPDKNGQKVIMDKRCSWCLKPFDKLNCVFALTGTRAAVWQV